MSSVTKDKPSKFARVLIKISGEALMGDKEFGHDTQTINNLAEDIKEVYDLGVEICLVVGGGNIFRGASSSSQGFERASNDYIGMLATVMNALSLQAALDRAGLTSRVLSAISMTTICETYIRRRAIRHLEKGRVVICAAGIGNPFFTTDTAAALRAVEMGCDAMLKGTQVNGVYSADPKHDINAERYDTLSYQDLLSRNLRVMDASAVSLARDNAVPIIVFALDKRGALAKVIKGEGIYTVISDQDKAQN